MNKTTIQIIGEVLGIIALLTFLAVCVALAGLLEGCAHAQTPQAHDNAFNWLEVSALGASTALDGWTTVRTVHRGGIEVQSPGLYGVRPTWASYSLPAFGISGASAFVGWHFERSRHVWLRIAGHIILNSETVGHLAGTAQNLNYRPAPVIGIPHPRVQKRR